MADNVGLPPGGIGWLADPQQRELADYTAGQDRAEHACWCGREATQEIPAGNQVWHRCDWHKFPTDS